jgi:hypothetical protein
MGEACRARDTRLDRTVALKVVRTDLPVIEECRRRFDETRAISQTSRPNDCPLFDICRGKSFDETSLSRAIDG